MAYQITFTEEARAQFSTLPRAIKPKMGRLIDRLAENPIPHNAKKMQGYETFYRIRFSEWRVIYEVLDDELIVEVIRVGNRHSVYRKPLT